MAKTMISARVDEKLNEGLEKLAVLTRRSKAFLITDALESYVDYETRLAQKIEAAVKEADESGEFISNEAMMKWLKSWGTPNELPPPEPDIFKKRQ
jgi:RHH-type transcriptional regulator, rel operon repressor / antitoxin RelB